jgi:hypothetical protein
MKKLILLFIFFSFLHSSVLRAEESNGGYGDESSERKSGFYLGGDSGVLAFLGNSSGVFSPAFTSGAEFGYSIRRLYNFQLRISSAFGSLDRNSANTFFFMTEFDTKIKFTKKAFSPFVLGGVGFYLLDFSGRDPLVANDTNLTYVAGGGFDYNFGGSAIGLGVNYRGFVNKLRDFQALEVLVQYSFYFF